MNEREQDNLLYFCSLIEFIDTVGECKYTVPSETSIGMVYLQLILSVCENDDIEQTIIDVFSSFISDEISDFNSNIYYSNPDYLRCSYLDRMLLA